MIDYEAQLLTDADLFASEYHPTDPCALCGDDLGADVSSAYRGLPWGSGAPAGLCSACYRSELKAGPADVLSEYEMRMARQAATEHPPS